MKGPSDVARRAFAAMKDGGGGSEDEGESPKPMDPGAAAGRRFKAALDGGDGTKIKAAFKALMDECAEYESEPAEGEE